MCVRSCMRACVHVCVCVRVCARVCERVFYKCACRPYVLVGMSEMVCMYGVRVRAVMCVVSISQWFIVLMHSYRVMTD